MLKPTPSAEVQLEPVAKSGYLRLLILLQYAIFPVAILLQAIVSAIAIAAGYLTGHFLRAAWAWVRSQGRDTAP